MKGLVVGLGESGKGAAKLLIAQGYEVVGMDRNPSDDCPFETRREGDPLDLSEFSKIVISPGIPPSHPIYGKKGVIGEAEFAFQTLKKQQIIGITGSNGKTTLTFLLAHILNRCGIKAVALGNVGTSLAAYAINPDPKTIIVAELSSFQLETMKTKAFDRAAIITITPDHLDRHGTFERYAKVKCHLIDLLKPGGKLIIPEAVSPFFPLRDSPLQLTSKDGYCEKLGDEGLALAAHLLAPYGVTTQDVERNAKTFVRPHHRLEFVKEIDGVRFIDDSKATNIEAVLFALKKVNAPLYMIVGGEAKGDSFKQWQKPFKEKVKGVFVIGKAAKKIALSLDGAIPLYQVATLERATEEAFKKAMSGETILLSPGCASYDQFKDYRQRGEMFKTIIKRLNR